jgi:adenosine deaminase
MPDLDLAGLPKAELHLHFEGAVRPATAAELANRAGRALPKTGPFRNLSEFVLAYETARDLIASLDDLHRIARELVQDAAHAGVVWTEVHLIPPTYAGRLGPAQGVLEAVLDGLRAGTTRAAGAGVIVGINRGLPLPAAEQSLRLAIAFAGHGVVGLGLAGDEANHPAAAFAAQFALARDAGLRLVPHGGEGAGPDSVRSCVEDLHADRICHGVHAVEDPQLLDLLAQRQVCLDVAPTSNVALGVSRSWPGHQLTALLNAGIPVTLNSDCPLFFRTSINTEYRRAGTNLGLDPGKLARIAETSLRRSSCPPELFHPALTQLHDWPARSSQPPSPETYHP